MSGRVLIWVQHLLGFGHFARARVVAETLRDAGFEVTLVSGGVTPADAAPAGVAFVQLPAVRAKDETFDELVDAAGRDADQALHAARRDLLIQTFHAARPEAIVTETFPFGRRLLEFELLALLDEARRAAWRPRIASSVRDVLQRPRKEARALAMIARAREFYDAVIVHGDPNVLRLEDSFAETAGIASRCVYTGYICAEMPEATAPRREILVSAGGGAAGRELITAAIAARPLSRHSGPWTFVTGPLSEALPQAEGATVVRSLPDFRARLAGAALSISQAGYNTLIETTRAATAAVVVPFETEREKEQATRAAAFASRGLVNVIRANELTPHLLADAITAVAGSTPPKNDIDFRGAAGTVRAMHMVLKS